VADYTVFPNPASSSVNLKGSHEIVSVEVLDMLGNIVMKTPPINARNFIMNTCMLAAGAYFLQTTFTDGSVRVKKILIF
jgi:hypothetical protein